MYKDEHITMIICGNKLANAGYGPLVSVEPGFYPEDRQYPGLSAVAEGFYSLQIRSDIAIVTKTINGVSSYGAGRAGTLRIGVSVPKGFGITNVYDLLSEIETSFKANYMTQSAANRWSFKPVDADPAVFRAIIDRYPLQPATVPYRPMSGDGPVAHLVTSRLREFFADFQYPEFAPYSEVLISTDGIAEGAQQLAGLVIPRDPSYTLCTRMGNAGALNRVDVVPNRLQVVHGLTINSPTPYYHDLLVPDFSVAELQTLPSFDKNFGDGNQISLDPCSESVIITYHLEPRTFHCRLVLQGTGDYNPSKLQARQFHLRNTANQVVSINDDFTFDLKGDMVAQLWTLQYSGRVEIDFPSGESFKVDPSHPEVKMLVSKPAPPPVPETHSPYMPGGSKAPAGAGDSRLDVEFPLYTITADPYWGDNSLTYPEALEGQLVFCDASEQVVYSAAVRLNPEDRVLHPTEGGSYMRYSANKRLPKNITGFAEVIRLERIVHEGKQYYFQTTPESGSTSRQTIAFVGDQRVKPRLMPILIPVIAGLLALIVGILLGYFVMQRPGTAPLTMPTGSDAPRQVVDLPAEQPAAPHPADTVKADTTSQSVPAALPSGEPVIAQPAADQPKGQPADALPTDAQPQSAEPAPAGKQALATPAVVNAPKSQRPIIQAQ